MPDDPRPAVPAFPGVPQPPIESAGGAPPADADAAPPADADAAPSTAMATPPGHAPGRIRRFTDRTREERTRLEDELQTRRQRSGMVDAGFQLQELDASVGGGILAGALAFRIFLFLVPFVYVVFTVLGTAAPSQDPAQLAKTLGITGVLASAIVTVHDQSAWTQALLVLGATGAVFITAGSLLKTLYVVHWLIWRVHRVMPSGLVPRLALIVFTLIASALGIAVNDVRNSSGLAGTIIAILLVSVLSFALWWWLSWKLPHAPVPARALIPGAVLIAIGAEVLHLLTVYWIGHLVARKTNTYGAVGIALAVLLWVYILGRIIVGSAGLNAALWHRRQDSGGRTDPGHTGG